ncbi:iron uptake transporter permease EfeU [Planosporangium mesophilum]|uniref:Iron transporter n=1 Tax=Planosporangium mesophilum TaxID=689768 RepID=A0A8J3X0Q4_9ACTN|nr:iron uptake transporter permease EfeU [Planosporangium mesophilum]NJC84973.1 iron transporter [Planosporangium mesophilum]GII23557.1 iron transporter [Planosporangium mesophilum]
MLNALLGNFLIGLREGLEATLVVTILVAFLVKSDRKERLPQVWAGVGAAVALSVGFGALLTFVAQDLLPSSKRELFDAVVSVVAVVFVTWMIFWMRRTSRKLSGELRTKLSDAINVGGFAVVGMAFLAVAREGLETATLFYTAAQGATTSAGPLAGITLGLVASIALGWALYASAVRINLATFFKWTGLLLVLVAAGILKYAVHDFHEAGVLPGGNVHAFDFSNVIDPAAWYSALVGGMFNLTPTMSVFELTAWLAYAVPVLFLFLRPARPVTRVPVTSAAA